MTGNNTANRRTLHRLFASETIVSLVLSVVLWALSLVALFLVCRYVTF
ncbi:MAG: hypothetical protein N3B18_05495 [Desulfobacterota bacterium]|nr:hypothetical protein [Thermodesulfobacteriota bacterium]